MAEAELNKFNCCGCGILMGLEPSVITSWKETHKIFTCPNGCKNTWSGKTEQEKELEKLREEVKVLKEKLVVVSHDLDIQKELNVTLVGELEIWSPNRKELLLPQGGNDNIIPTKKEPL